MASGNVITLQFGTFSNFVGTHLFNLQEWNSISDEVDFEVLLRERNVAPVNGQRQYSPRVLLVDVKGALQRSESDLLDVASISKQSRNWDGKIVNINNRIDIEDGDVNADDVHNADSDETKKANEAKKVRNGSSWSDYRIHDLNQKNIHVLNQFTHVESTFSSFGQGRSVYCGSVKDDIEEKIRVLAEDCNHLTAFHILTDADNGFSGLSSAVTDHLSDEYGGAATLPFPLLSHEFLSNKISLLNLAMSVDSFNNSCPLIVPLSTCDWDAKYQPIQRKFRQLSYKMASLYESSSLLASYIDTITLPYRLKRPLSITDYISSIKLAGCNMMSSSLALPVSLRSASDTNELPIWQKLSPWSATDFGLCWRQNLVLKGLSLFNESLSSGDALARWLPKANQDGHLSPLTRVNLVSEPLIIKKPFPPIFNQGLMPDRCVVPVGAGLHNDKGIVGMLNVLTDELKMLVSKLGRFHHVSESGIERDEISECLESLLTMKDCYSSY